MLNSKPDQNRVLHTFCLFVLTFSLSTCNNHEVTVNSLDQLDCSELSLPISSSQEAICIAVQNEIVRREIQALDERMRASQVELKGWYLNARQEKDGSWFVSVKSKGVIPSFQCDAYFDKEGNALKTIDCSFNK